MVRRRVSIPYRHGSTEEIVEEVVEIVEASQFLIGMVAQIYHDIGEQQNENVCLNSL